MDQWTGTGHALGDVAQTASGWQGVAFIFLMIFVFSPFIYVGYCSLKNAAELEREMAEQAAKEAAKAALAAQPKYPDLWRVGVDPRPFAKSKASAG